MMSRTPAWLTNVPALGGVKMGVPSGFVVWQTNIGPLRAIGGVKIPRIFGVPIHLPELAASSLVQREAAVLSNTRVVVASGRHYTAFPFGLEDTADLPAAQNLACEAASGSGRRAAHTGN